MGKAKKASKSFDAVMQKLRSEPSSVNAGKALMTLLEEYEQVLDVVCMDEDHFTTGTWAWMDGVKHSIEDLKDYLTQGGK